MLLRCSTYSAHPCKPNTLFLFKALILSLILISFFTLFTPITKAAQTRNIFASSNIYETRSTNQKTLVSNIDIYEERNTKQKTTISSSDINEELSIKLPAYYNATTSLTEEMNIKQTTIIAREQIILADLWRNFSITYYINITSDIGEEWNGTAPRTPEPPPDILTPNFIAIIGFMVALVTGFSLALISKTGFTGGVVATTVTMFLVSYLGMTPYWVFVLFVLGVGLILWMGGGKE